MRTTKPENGVRVGGPGKGKAGEASGRQIKKSFVSRAPEVYPGDRMPRWGLVKVLRGLQQETGWLYWYLRKLYEGRPLLLVQCPAEYLSLSRVFTENEHMDGWRLAASQHLTPTGPP